MILLILKINLFVRFWWLSNQKYPFKVFNTDCIILGFDKQFIFKNSYSVFQGWVIPLILKTSFHILLVVISMTLSVKNLKTFIYFWVAIIAFLNILSLYNNHTTNSFVPVVQKNIHNIMLSVRTSLLRESIFVDSLVYFSLICPCFAGLFKSILLSSYQAYILASW